MTKCQNHLIMSWMCASMAGHISDRVEIETILFKAKFRPLLAVH